MSSKPDPDWEVVDELPGEKKPEPRPGNRLPWLKSKRLWFGLLAGGAIVLLFPLVRVMLQNAARAWWIWLALALYWVWRRMNRVQRKR